LYFVFSPALLCLYGQSLFPHFWEPRVEEERSAVAQFLLASGAGPMPNEHSGRMKKPDFTDLDCNIAVTRIILSILAMISLYIDPTTAGGMFHLVCHLAYSVSAYSVLRSGSQLAILQGITATLDLSFAAAVAFLTEGQTSPSYVFFVFAIIAVGIRGGLRATATVTLCCVCAYLFVTAISDAIMVPYVMRAVYLAIAGSLVGFLGWRRANFERRVHELEARADRESIARSLHDGYVQALAAIILRLQTCKELLGSDRRSEVESEIDELRVGLQREYDKVRSYLRSLAGVAASGGVPSGKPSNPHLRINASFEAHAVIGEQVLSIMLEALRNARRHAAADSITIIATAHEKAVTIDVHDDGVGFPPSADPPWTIASRVAELGGRVSLGSNSTAHIQVEIPNR
jgi:signal transduction histidine kinase